MSNRSYTDSHILSDSCISSRKNAAFAICVDYEIDKKPDGASHRFQVLGLTVHN